MYPQYMHVFTHVYHNGIKRYQNISTEYEKRQLHHKIHTAISSPYNTDSFYFIIELYQGETGLIHGHAQFLYTPYLNKARLDSIQTKLAHTYGVAWGEHIKGSGTCLLYLLSLFVIFNKFRRQPAPLRPGTDVLYFLNGFWCAGEAGELKSYPIFLCMAPDARSFYRKFVEHPENPCYEILHPHIIPDKAIEYFIQKDILASPPPTLKDYFVDCISRDSYRARFGKIIQPSPPKKALPPSLQQHFQAMFSRYSRLPSS